MDSSVTEHYLEYDSDQFDTWLKDFDTQQDSSEDEVYTDVSVSSVVNRRKKNNSIFVKQAPKRRSKQKKIETTIEYSESIVKPKVTRPRSRKVPLFFLKRKKTTKSITEKNVKKNEFPKKQIKRLVKKNYSDQVNWDIVNINDLNLILPNI